MLCQLSYAGSAGVRGPASPRPPDAVAARRPRGGARHDDAARRRAGTTRGGGPMRYKATFITGFAAGYVLGARAGRARYEQIAKAWRSLVGTPEVRHVAETARHEAVDLLGTAKRVVTD